MTPERLKEIRDSVEQLEIRTAAADRLTVRHPHSITEAFLELLAHIDRLEADRPDFRPACLSVGNLAGAYEQALSDRAADREQIEQLEKRVEELEANRDNGKWVAAAMKRAGCVPITIEAHETLREDQRRLDWVEEQRAISFGFPIGAAEVASDMELGKPINVVMKTGLGTHKVTSAAGTKRQCIDAARQSQQKPEGK